MKLLAATLFLAAAAFGRSHTALNGTWTLEPAKSDFAGQPVLQTGTVTINEREGNLTISRNFIYQGNHQTFFYNDTADSENSATIRSGDVKSKARWDHDVLKVATTEAGVTTIESYRLAPDGSMIANVDRPGHPPVSLVYRRQ